MQGRDLGILWSNGNLYCGSPKEGWTRYVFVTIVHISHDLNLSFPVLFLKIWQYRPTKPATDPEGKYHTSYLICEMDKLSVMESFKIQDLELRLLPSSLWVRLSTRESIWYTLTSLSDQWLQIRFLHPCPLVDTISSSITSSLRSMQDIWLLQECWWRCPKCKWLLCTHFWNWRKVWRCWENPVWPSTGHQSTTVGHWPVIGIPICLVLYKQLYYLWFRELT